MNKTVKTLLLVGAAVAGIILVKKVVEKRTAEAEKTEKGTDDQEVSEKYELGKENLSPHSFLFDEGSTNWQ